jgi:acetate kinase
MKVLVLNSGSSSQKSALFELDGSTVKTAVAPLWEARIEWRGPIAEMEVRGANGARVREQSEAREKGLQKDRQTAVDRMLGTLCSGKTRVLETLSEIDVVGHRVVHGGNKLNEPTRITPDVKAAIASVAAFAPLHNRAELAGIETIERLIGSVPQIAVFDTGFHRTLPEEASVYPGPYAWYEQGIRRYGFHGINHQYCAQKAAEMLGRDSSGLRLVSCHLGNGCSLAAISGGRSIDTTMGFTPLDGLMMGTRSGSVDPGILTYLLRQGQTDGQKLDDLLNKESGLLGISGVSGDMREVVAAMHSGNNRASLAFHMFVHRLTAGICAMAASLGGLDALIFTAGIGENSQEVRAESCSRLAFLGVTLDAGKNAQPVADREISTPQSSVRVLVVRAQEDWAIAKDCWQLMNGDRQDRP